MELRCAQWVRKLHVTPKLGNKVCTCLLMNYKSILMHVG